jgi:hypothetical protein
MSRSVRALWFAIYLSAASLQACSSFGPPAVSIPLPKDLDRFSQELDQLNKVPGNDLVNVGYAAADLQCDTFFAALQEARNRNAFDAAEVAAIAGMVVPGMTLLHAGAKAIGITGGILGLGATTIANYGQYALLLRYDAQLQDLVHDAQTSYKVKIAADQGNVQLTSAQAYDIVGGYAWLCTLPGIDSLARKALGTAKTIAAAIPPPTPIQIAALRTVGNQLGLAAGTSLTVDQAAALIVFDNNPGVLAASENVRRRFSADQVMTMFNDNGAGTKLTARKRTFANALSILHALQGFAALDKAVADQMQAVTTGAGAPPSSGASPEAVIAAPPQFLPEVLMRRPSLGVTRPQIEIRR